MSKGKEKKSLNYVDAHNKAVKSYKRSSLFILWGGIINLLSAIMGVFNLGVSGNEQFGINYRYSLTLASNRFIFNALEYSEMNIFLTNAIIIMISLAMGVLLAMLGYFASTGKFKYLIAGGIIYLVDFVFTFIYDNVLVNAFNHGFIWTLYMFSIGVHVVIIAFVIIAMIQYYHVFAIENKHQKEMQKALEMEKE